MRYQIRTKEAFVFSRMGSTSPVGLARQQKYTKMPFPYMFLNNHTHSEVPKYP